MTEPVKLRAVIIPRVYEGDGQLSFALVFNFEFNGSRDVPAGCPLQQWPDLVDKFCRELNRHPEYLKLQYGAAGDNATYFLTEELHPALSNTAQCTQLSIAAPVRTSEQVEAWNAVVSKYISPAQARPMRAPAGTYHGTNALLRATQNDQLTLDVNPEAASDTRPRFRLESFDSTTVMNAYNAAAQMKRMNKQKGFRAVMRAVLTDFPNLRKQIKAAKGDADRNSIIKSHLEKGLSAQSKLLAAELADAPVAKKDVLQAQILEVQNVAAGLSAASFAKSAAFLHAENVYTVRNTDTDIHKAQRRVEASRDRLPSNRAKPSDVEDFEGIAQELARVTKDQGIASKLGLIVFGRAKFNNLNLPAVDHSVMGRFGVDLAPFETMLHGFKPQTTATHFLLNKEFFRARYKSQKTFDTHDYAAWYRHGMLSKGDFFVTQFDLVNGLNEKDGTPESRVLLSDAIAISLVSKKTTVAEQLSLRINDGADSLKQEKVRQAEADRIAALGSTDAFPSTVFDFYAEHLLLGFVVVCGRRVHTERAFGAWHSLCQRRASLARKVHQKDWRELLDAEEEGCLGHTISMSAAPLCGIVKAKALFTPHLAQVPRGIQLTLVHPEASNVQPGQALPPSLDANETEVVVIGQGILEETDLELKQLDPTRITSLPIKRPRPESILLGDEARVTLTGGTTPAAGMTSQGNPLDTVSDLLLLPVMKIPAPMGGSVPGFSGSPADLEIYLKPEFSVLRKGYFSPSIAIDPHTQFVNKVGNPYDFGQSGPLVECILEGERRFILEAPGEATYIAKSSKVDVPSPAQPLNPQRVFCATLPFSFVHTIQLRPDGDRLTSIKLPFAGSNPQLMLESAMESRMGWVKAVSAAGSQFIPPSRNTDFCVEFDFGGKIENAIGADLTLPNGRTVRGFTAQINRLTHSSTVPFNFAVPNTQIQAQGTQFGNDVIVKGRGVIDKSNGACYVESLKVLGTVSARPDVVPEEIRQLAGTPFLNYRSVLSTLRGDQLVIWPNDRIVAQNIFLDPLQLTAGQLVESLGEVTSGQLVSRTLPQQAFGTISERTVPGGTRVKELALADGSVFQLGNTAVVPGTGLVNAVRAQNQVVVTALNLSEPLTIMGEVGNVEELRRNLKDGSSVVEGMAIRLAAAPGQQHPSLYTTINESFEVLDADHPRRRVDDLDLGDFVVADVSMYGGRFNVTKLRSGLVGTLQMNSESEALTIRSALVMLTAAELTTPRGVRRVVWMTQEVATGHNNNYVALAGADVIFCLRAVERIGTTKAFERGPSERSARQGLSSPGGIHAMVGDLIGRWSGWSLGIPLPGHGDVKSQEGSTSQTYRTRLRTVTSGKSPAPCSEFGTPAAFNRRQVVLREGNHYRFCLLHMDMAGVPAYAVAPNANFDVTRLEQHANELMGFDPEFVPQKNVAYQRIAAPAAPMFARPSTGELALESSSTEGAPLKNAPTHQLVLVSDPLATGQTLVYERSAVGAFIPPPCSPETMFLTGEFDEIGKRPTKEMATFFHDYQEHIVDGRMGVRVDGRLNYIPEPLGGNLILAHSQADGTGERMHRHIQVSRTRFGPPATAEVPAWPKAHPLYVKLRSAPKPCERISTEPVLVSMKGQPAGLQLEIALAPGRTGRCEARYNYKLPGNIHSDSTQIIAEKFLDIELRHATTAPVRRPQWNDVDGLEAIPARQPNQTKQRIAASVTLDTPSTGSIGLKTYRNEYWDEAVPALLTEATGVVTFDDAGRAKAVRITNPGAGYATQVIVDVETEVGNLPGPNGQKATLTAEISGGRIMRVRIERTGTGYFQGSCGTAKLRVRRRPPLTSFARARARVVDGKIVECYLDSENGVVLCGGYYLTPPMVVIHDIGGDGFGAQVRAVLNDDGEVSKLTVDCVGTGYSDNVEVGIYTHSTAQDEQRVPYRKAPARAETKDGEIEKIVWENNEEAALLRAQWFDAPPLITVLDLESNGAGAIVEAVLSGPAPGGRINAFKIRNAGSGWSSRVAVGIYIDALDAESNPLSTDDKMSHEWSFDQAVDTTNHYLLRYVAEAASRHRDFLHGEFGPSNGLDGAEKSVWTRVRPRLTPPRDVDILCAARPALPVVDYMVPSFSWETQYPAEGGIKISRRCAARCYLERPWNMTGRESLGVVVMKAVSNTTKLPKPLDELKGIPAGFRQLVSQWGYDPVWDHNQLSPLRLDNFFLREEPAQPYDELFEMMGLGARPVSVAVHRTEFDKHEDRWYADVGVATPERGDPFIGDPFIQFAFVRYQPKAIAGHCISAVLLCPDMFLHPGERHLHLFRNGATLHVRFTGRASDSNEAVAPQFPNPATGPFKPFRRITATFRTRKKGWPEDIRGDLVPSASNTRVELSRNNQSYDFVGQLSIPIGISSKPDLTYYVEIEEFEIYKTSEDQRTSTNGGTILIGKEVCLEKLVYARNIDLANIPTRA